MRNLEIDGQELAFAIAASCCIPDWQELDKNPRKIRSAPDSV